METDPNKAIAVKINLFSEFFGGNGFMTRITTNVCKDILQNGISCKNNCMIHLAGIYLDRNFTNIAVLISSVSSWEAIGQINCFE